MLSCVQKISGLIVFLFAGNAFAMSKISDRDLIVSLRNNLPCFSYPIDEETKNEGYSFGYMDVTWNDRESSLPGHLAWTLDIDIDNKIPVYPNKPDFCLGYGDTPPGTSDKRKGAALPMRYDVSYRAHMSVLKKGSTYTRKYETWFCLSRNKANQTIILQANWKRATSKFECVPL